MAELNILGHRSQSFFVNQLSPNSGKFTFQVGAFRNRGNAERLKLKLGRAYKNAHISTFDAGDGLYYRVRVGDFASLEEARKGEEILLRDGYPAFVVAE